MIGKLRPWAEVGSSVQRSNVHNRMEVSDENELVLLSATLLLLLYSLNSCCRLSRNEDLLVTVVSFLGWGMPRWGQCHRTLLLVGRPKSSEQSWGCSLGLVTPFRFHLMWTAASAALL